MNKAFAFTGAGLAALLLVGSVAAQTPAAAPAVKTCTVTGPAGNRVQLTGVACDRAAGAHSTKARSATPARIPPRSPPAAVV